MDGQVKKTMQTCWAAKENDLLEIMQLYANGINLEETDYDGRSPLHLAAAEGNMEIVKYLVKKIKNCNSVDRWGHTPLMEAKKNNHSDIANYIEKLIKGD